MLRVEMLGRVGRDPETRYMPSGGAVTNFSMAHTDRWKDKETGEQKERTEWVRVVAFNRQAEIIGDHVKKGALLWVAGTLQTRDYMKDGVKTYTTEVKVKEFEFASSKNDNHPGEKRDDQPADDFDDDIPF
mgnify:FL=1